MQGIVNILTFVALGIKQVDVSTSQIDPKSNGVDNVHRRLSEEELFSTIAFVTIDAGRARDLVRVGILEKTEDRLFIVVGSLDYLMTTLSTVAEAVTERFLFFSKWLIITENYPSIKLTGRFENMALIIPKSYLAMEEYLFPTEQNTLHFLDMSKSLVQFPCDTRVETLKVVGDNKFFKKIYVEKNCGQPGEMRSSPAWFPEKIFPNPKGGLNGRTIKFGTAPWYPFVSETSNGSWSGYSIDFINEIAAILNFQPKHVTYPENGSEWTIIYDQLAKKKLDMVAVPLHQSKQRRQTMDFVFPPASYVEYYVFYKAPVEVDLQWRVVVDTVSWIVLVLTSISLVCTACLLVIFENVTKCDQTCLKAMTWVPIRTYTWILFGNLVNQGQHFIAHQKSVPSRMILSAWCIFCLVLSVTFTAYLVPALGVSKPTVLFKSIDDLLNNDDYKWGMYGQGSQALNFLTTSRKREHRELYKGMEKFNRTDPEVLSSTVNQNVKRLLSEEYAFIEATTSMRLFSNECDITYIHDRIVMLPSYYVTYKDSPLTELISERYFTLLEIGWKQRTEEKQNGKITCQREQQIPVAVGMAHIYSVLLLGAVGITMATITLLCEIGINRKFHSH